MKHSEMLRMAEGAQAQKMMNELFETV
jgi:hypothetical protein